MLLVARFATPALVTCPTLSRLGPSADSPAVVHCGAEVPVVQPFDRVEFGLRQRRQTGRLGLLPGLGGAAGAGDHGGYPGLLDDPAQRPLSRSAAGQAAGSGRELG